MMSKFFYCLLLLMTVLIPTGCETVKGAATGLQQDIQNTTNPDKNGWNALEQVDAWIRQNMW